jgi:hypothetical protein
MKQSKPLTSILQGALGGLLLAAALSTALDARASGYSKRIISYHQTYEEVIKTMPNQSSFVDPYEETYYVIFEEK